MFARLTQRPAPRPTRTAPAAPARPAMFEALEDRQLYSVSPVSQLPAVQKALLPAAPAVTVTAVQQPASTNIIAILIGL
jgi:hypothetical protein